jgi:hypothetical protein
VVSVHVNILYKLLILYGLTYTNIYTVLGLAYVAVPSLSPGRLPARRSPCGLTPHERLWPPTKPAQVLGPIGWPPTNAAFMMTARSLHILRGSVYIAGSV